MSFKPVKSAAVRNDSRRCCDPGRRNWLKSAATLAGGTAAGSLLVATDAFAGEAPPAAPAAHARVGGAGCVACDDFNRQGRR